LVHLVPPIVTLSYKYTRTPNLFKMVVRLPPFLLALLLALLCSSSVEAEAMMEEDCQVTIAELRDRIQELEAELKASYLAVDALNLGESLDPPGSPEFYRHCVCAFCCVVLAALAAGLTMGMVSIEPMEMTIIVNTEDKDMTAEKDKLKLKEDQTAAQRVLPLIQDHHRLLVTLLLLNSLANEALPLFLDRIVPSWMAVVLSVSLVLMFGEIIPSAIFTGSEQLRIAAMFAPVVAVCQFILAPISWPIAKVLDVMLGEDHKGRYNFAELRAIVGIHANLRSDEPQAAVFKSVDDKGLGIITTEKPHHFTDETIVIFTSTNGAPAKSTKLEANGRYYYVKPCEPITGRDKSCTFRLYTTESRDVQDVITFKKGELESGAFLVQERDEIKIMHGVMKLTHMRAVEGYRPLSETDMLESSEPLTRELLQSILEKGHSRLPVYCENKHNVRGFILSKKMIVITPDDGSKVSNIEISPMVLVSPEIPMLDLLNKFQSERCHIALLCSEPELVKEAWASNTIIPPDVHMMGIITMEDIIEKLIQEDIFDEHDETTPRSVCSYMTPRVKNLERSQSPPRTSVPKTNASTMKQGRTLQVTPPPDQKKVGLKEPLLGQSKTSPLDHP